MNCSVSCRRASVYSDDESFSGVEKCERMELWSGDRGDVGEERGRGGSSRSIRR